MLASLRTEIQFTGINNETIVLPPETVVYVDVAEGIACYEMHAFDIFKYEYEAVN